MTLDEAFDALGDDAADPRPAMRCLLDDWPSAEPQCLALLQRFASGLDTAERAPVQLLPILYLLAERRVTASFPGVCALAGNAELASLVFDDEGAVLPQILVSCFDGATPRLQALIDPPGHDPVTRESALLAMAYLAQTGRIPRATMHAYLTTLFDTLPAGTDAVLWSGVAATVALLGFRALSGRVTALFEQGRIDPGMMRLEDFRTDLRAALEDPAGLDGFEALGVGPVQDALLAFEQPEEAVAPVPHVNPLRNVGRNDPCPCGSGRKFKRCCLVDQ